MQNNNIQEQLDRELNQFTGTEKYYRHLTGLVYTDGVQYLAEHYRTYWLIDEILSINKFNETIDREFQVWKLSRVFAGSGEPTTQFNLVCEDGNDNVVFSKQIGFSDFKADKVELWFADNVLSLPSEH